MTDATADARADTHGDGDVLLELASLLADSVPRLERAEGVGAERCLELVRAGVQTLEAAARHCVGPADSPGARDPEALRHWLHELRAPVTAIAGWVHMLDEVPPEATRVRATEAIERNATRLSELLAHRPV